MTNNQPFSRRLRAARLAKAAQIKETTGSRAGLSQESLGIAVGIAEETASARMNQYEQGVHLPDLEMARKIAEVLEVPLAYLFCEEDDLAELLLTASKLDAGARQVLISAATAALTGNLSP